MSISVYCEASDGLARERWDFNVSTDWTGKAMLVLTEYAVERRAAAKGRWRKADAGDRWMAADERRYASGLARPTSIPDWVLKEAQSKVEWRFHIGWTNAESEIGRAA